MKNDHQEDPCSHASSCSCSSSRLLSPSPHSRDLERPIRQHGLTAPWRRKGSPTRRKTTRRPKPTPPPCANRSRRPSPAADRSPFPTARPPPTKGHPTPTHQRLP